MMRDGLVVQWPDTHVPDHHRGAVRSLLSFIGETKPRLVILTGDFFDMLTTARWTHDTIEENGRLLQSELDAGRRILGDLRNVYTGRIAWIPGNHEARLAKWGRTRGRGVFGIDCLTVPALANFADLNIETPGGTTDETVPWEFAPGIFAIHGTTVRKLAGYTVHAEMEKFGKSIIMGHTHRLALVHRSNPSRSIFGIEGGHLMDQRRAGYLPYGVADWQMGFSVIELRDGKAWPTVVPMDKAGGFMYQGEKF